MIVPSLAGCVTFGETVEEAIEMAREAIEGYIETLMELGRDVPIEDDGFVDIASFETHLSILY